LGGATVSVVEAVNNNVLGALELSINLCSDHSELFFLLNWISRISSLSVRVILTKAKRAVLAMRFATDVEEAWDVAGEGELIIFAVGLVLKQLWYLS